MTRLPVHPSQINATALSLMKMFRTSTSRPHQLISPDLIASIVRARSLARRLYSSIGAIPQLTRLLPGTTKVKRQSRPRVTRPPALTVHPASVRSLPKRPCSGMIVNVTHQQHARTTHLLVRPLMSATSVAVRSLPNLLCSSMCAIRRPTL